MARKKDGKEREVFDLDPTFQKIQQLFFKDEEEKLKAAIESELGVTIQRFEQGLGRLLMPYELDQIRQWYEGKIYTHEAVIQAIETAKDRVSVKYVERILTRQIPEKIEIDDAVDEALDEIFKKIK